MFLNYIGFLDMLVATWKASDKVVCNIQSLLLWPSSCVDVPCRLL
jgi:hypothetical protein